MVHAPLTHRAIIKTLRIKCNLRYGDDRDMRAKMTTSDHASSLARYMSELLAVSSVSTRSWSMCSQKRTFSCKTSTCNETVRIVRFNIRFQSLSEILNFTMQCVEFVKIPFCCFYPVSFRSWILLISNTSSVGQYYLLPTFLHSRIFDELNSVVSCVQDERNSSPPLVDDWRL